MRWGYVSSRAMLLAAVWAFFAFGFDPLLHHELTSAGQKALSAKVDVAAVRTSLFPPRLSIQNLRAANRDKPGTNLLEIDALDLRVAGGPLLKKLYIIDEGTVTGLRSGTPREDSGLLPEKPAEKQAREEAAQAAADNKSGFEDELRSRSRQFLDALAGRAKLELDPQQFESLRLGTEIEKRWMAEFDRLETESTDLKRQIGAIEQKVKSVSGNKIERLDAYRSATTDSAKLLQEIKQLKDELAAQQQQARQDFAAFNQAKQHDLAEIREKADLFRTDPQQLTELLLGPELNHRIAEVVGWIQTTRALLERRKQNALQPQRMRGEQIAFARRPELPEFLIKLLKIEGETELDGQPLQFRGTISDITSDPVIHGKPAILRLRGQGAAELDVKAVFDDTDPLAEPTQQVLLRYTAAHPEALRLGSSDSLSVSVSAEKLTLRAEIKVVGDAVTGKLILQQEPATLDAKLAGQAARVDPHVNDAIADAFAGIEKLDAEMHISGRLAKPQWSIQSNLGEQVAGGLNAALSKLLEGERQALTAKLDEALTKQSGRLQDLFKERTKAVTAQLNGHEQEIKQLVQQAMGGRLADLDKIAGKPLDALKKSADPRKGGPPADFSLEEERAKDGLKKLFRR